MRVRKSGGGRYGIKQRSKAGVCVIGKNARKTSTNDSDYSR